MDSPTFTVLIAVAGLVAGLVLCWLFMRGRSAAPAVQTKLEQAELAQARGHIRQLEEERKLAVKNYEDLKHETARTRGVANAVRKDTAPLAEHVAQVTALQAQLATLQAQEQATRTDAARVRSEGLAEQAQAKEYFRSLENNQQLAAASAQALKLDADRLREALDAAQKERTHAVEQAAQVPALQARLAAALQHQDKSNQPAAPYSADGQAAESAESLKRAQARVLVLEQENASLKQRSAAMSASAQGASPAAAPAQATQLPVLEEQVLALQNLEKAIKKEFQLLSEIQRNVTLTSATRHEFNESPESRTGNAAAA